MSGFITWIDTPNAGTGGNIIGPDTLETDSQREEGFKAGDPASALRVNAALRQSTLVTAALMEMVGGDTSYLSSKNVIKTAMSDFFTTNIPINFLTNLERELPASGASISEFFGKTYAYLKDLQAAAYYPVSASVPNSNDRLPTAKAVYRCTFERVYRSLSDISSSLSNDSTILQVCRSMSDDSYLFMQVVNETNLHPTGSGMGILEIMRKNSYCVIRFTATRSEKIFTATLDVLSATELSWSWIQLDITAPITFTEASTRTNIESGETTPTIFGKIKKWFSSLGSLAFKSSITNSDISSTAAIANSKLAGIANTQTTGNICVIAHDGTISSLNTPPVTAVVRDDRSFQTLSKSQLETSFVNFNDGLYEFLITSLMVTKHVAHYVRLSIPSSHQSEIVSSPFKITYGSSGYGDAYLRVDSEGKLYISVFYGGDWVSLKNETNLEMIQYRKLSNH